MRDRWTILFFNRKNNNISHEPELLHKESDMHLIPRVGDTCIIPNYIYIAIVKEVLWDYKKKEVKVIL